MFYVTWAYRYAVDLQPRFVVAHRPIALAALALLALAPLSIVNAADTQLVWLEWTRLLLLVVAMLAAMSLQDARLVRLWIFALSAQVVLQAALACAQYLLRRSLGLDMFGEQALQEQDIGKLVSRPTGTIGNPNVLGYFFEILLPLMFALALARQPARWRLWYAFACLAGLAGIVATLSRGAGSRCRSPSALCW